jgi:hypothetical protein
MKVYINSKYLIQLGSSFFIGLFSLIFLFLTDSIDELTPNLLILCIFGACFYTLLNAILNYPNLTFHKKQSVLLAFHLPLILWGIFVLIVLIELLESKGEKLTDWMLMLWFIEPFLYNFFLRRSALAKEFN